MNEYQQKSALTRGLTHTPFRFNDDGEEKEGGQESRLINIVQTKQ